mmetsp:Transcript_141012/g.245775  ORF Transcript_141012/g.245775 Transcript_141012/m.245775 type:complete len:202 (-) Transcript_141012:570-1175(-)
MFLKDVKFSVINFGQALGELLANVGNLHLKFRLNIADGGCCCQQQGAQVGPVGLLLQRLPYLLHVLYDGVLPLTCILPHTLLTLLAFLSKGLDFCLHCHPGGLGIDFDIMDVESLHHFFETVPQACGFLQQDLESGRGMQILCLGFFSPSLMGRVPVNPKQVVQQDHVIVVETDLFLVVTNTAHDLFTGTLKTGLGICCIR